MVLSFVGCQRLTLALLALIGLTACGPTDDGIASPDASVPSNPNLPLGGTAKSSAFVTLAWDQVIAADLAGYRVYYGRAPGSFEQPPGAGVFVGTVTFISLDGLERGSTYYFAVTSVDFAGNESAPSNEVNRHFD